MGIVTRADQDEFRCQNTDEVLKDVSILRHH